MGVVRTGDPVPLTYQSPFKDAALHIRAVVTKPDGSPVTGSPFALPHVTTGSYRAAAYPLMDSSSWWLIRYEPFLDAGYSVPSGLEGAVEDVMHQGVPIEPQPHPANAVGRVGGSDASGAVAGDDVTGAVTGSAAKGTLDPTDDAEGTASGNDTTGTVDC